MSSAASRQVALDDLRPLCVVPGASEAAQRLAAATAAETRLVSDREAAAKRADGDTDCLGVVHDPPATDARAVIESVRSARPGLPAVAAVPPADPPTLPADGRTDYVRRVDDWPADLRRRAARLAVDDDGEVAASASGPEPDTARRRSLWEVFPGAQDTVWETGFRAVADTGQPRSFEKRVDQLRSWFEVDAYPDGGGVAVYFRDVTDRRRRHRHHQVLNRVLRHNVRNGVQIVHGFAAEIREQAAGKLDPEPTEEMADRIMNGSDRLAKLSDRAQDIEELLGAEADTLGSVDAASVCREAVDRVDATVTVVAPETAPVRANPQLRRAVIELVENAATHGAPPVRVTVAAADREGWTAVRVTDDGPGIPEREQAVLSGTEITQLVHGRGLGLWLVSGSSSPTVARSGSTRPTGRPYRCSCGGASGWATSGGRPRGATRGPERTEHKYDRTVRAYPRDGCRHRNVHTYALHAPAVPSERRRRYRVASPSSDTEKGHRPNGPRDSKSDGPSYRR
jgi:signal transduction histidine kinase